MYDGVGVAVGHRDSFSGRWHQRDVEALRACVVTRAVEDEPICAHLVGADGERRHSLSVQCGRVVGAKCEGRFVVFHDWRYFNIIVQTVGFLYAADGAYRHYVQRSVANGCCLADFVLGDSGIDLRALCLAHRLGVVATRACTAAAHEGGTIGSDGCLVGSRRNVGVRGIKRIDEGVRFAVVPAHEAATFGGASGGKHTTRVHTAGEVHIALRVSGKAAVGAVAAVGADTAMDDGADVAVGDGCRAARLGNQSGSELLSGVDVARHLQVLDGGTIGVAERGAVWLVKSILGAAFREGQRVNAVAEEGALEPVVACTHHLRNADVGSQLHELPFEVRAAVADVVGECVPFVGTADGVGVALSA